jgi:hypothetical protein
MRPGYDYTSLSLPRSKKNLQSVYIQAPGITSTHRPASSFYLSLVLGCPHEQSWMNRATRISRIRKYQIGRPATRANTNKQGNHITGLYLPCALAAAAINWMDRPGIPLCQASRLRGPADSLKSKSLLKEQFAAPPEKTHLASLHCNTESPGICPPCPVIIIA